MKNLFLALAFTTGLFTTSVSAQKVTEKELQGNWKLSTYVAYGASLNVETGEVTVPKEIEKSTNPGILKQIKDNMSQLKEQLKTSYIYITGNNFRQIIADEVKDGPFTLKEGKGSYVIAANFDDGTSSNIPVSINDKGQLHIKNNINKQEFIYTRE